MHNLRQGFLVVEGCFECGARTSFFSTEPVAPIDEYREGRHFWVHRGHFQTVRFDLRCRGCGDVVVLDDVYGLMLSDCGDRDCQVGALVSRQESFSLVYVALCEDSTHETGKCVSDEGIEALNQYFNRNAVTAGRRIVVVPCRLCNNIDKCHGTVIADVGLTDIS